MRLVGIPVQLETKQRLCYIPPMDKTSLNYDRLVHLKKRHPALRLLQADSAPLIISFLFQVFILPNQRELLYSELESKLQDFLYHLRELYGAEAYPRAAKEYLNDWTSDETPYLRKYYPRHSDEPKIDVTPSVEKVIEWLQSLEQQEFVGTESRLLTLFQVLRDTVKHTELDPDVRIAELEAQKLALEEEIANIKQGHIRTYDTTQIKERFYQAEDISRKLLSDFRQVEYNFRELDRETREQIATSEQSKGTVLSTIFAKHDVIRESDQGKSFKAFWEFLMSRQRQEELDSLLQTVYHLPELQTITQNDFLAKIKYYLLEAAEKVYSTNSLLAEQLRKYLDDQAYLENKRILNIIKDIEKITLQIKDDIPKSKTFFEIDQVKPTIELPISRSLFTVPVSAIVNSASLEAGSAQAQMDSLFNQAYVDEKQLRQNIKTCLQKASQVSLKEIATQHPINKGLAELITYVKIANSDNKAQVYTDEFEQVSWLNANGIKRAANMPKILFTR